MGKYIMFESSYEFSIDDISILENSVCLIFFICEQDKLNFIHYKLNYDNNRVILYRTVVSKVILGNFE